MTYRNSGWPVYWSVWRSENTDDNNTCMYPSGLCASAYLMRCLKKLMTSLTIHGKVSLVPQNWNQNSEAGRRLTTA